uniref:benzoate carboxyl methyltransferase-like n=1 Tax=Erigeron canadensis TaxID=72917 RepID=UPI001CB94277|nr:benzoate carboxyl methyltransferase-like [Erigeron canadensis]
MKVETILCMNTGDGESSYANNSLVQELATRRVLPILRYAIKGIANQDILFKDECFKIADMGCSSGKNTLLVVSSIIDIVYEMYTKNNREAPAFQVCLNDLYGNDFNHLFKLMPDFYAKIRKGKKENFGPCFVSAVPGSFYTRLFPEQSLHIVYSSYSVQWLSQVPQGLGENKLNLYITKTSPPKVIQAYQQQFHWDFTTFLKMRSKEIVPGGKMVLAFPARSINDPTSDDCCSLWELLAQSLLDMAKKGLVQQSDIMSFNMPFYYPCEGEVRKLIKNQGSFSLDKLNVFQVNWDPYDTDYTSIKDSSESSYIHGKNAARIIRAVAEPFLKSHFGSSMIKELFEKYEEHLAKHLVNKKTRHFTIAISMTKKVNNIDIVGLCDLECDMASAD